MATSPLSTGLTQKRVSTWNSHLDTPPHTYTPWEKGKKTKFDSKNNLLPKKHAKFRNYGELQVPESTLIAPVKGKGRQFPVVILIGSAAPINDVIMGIAVDLSGEGVDAGLKHFPAWKSLPHLIWLVLTPHKPASQRYNKW